MEPQSDLLIIKILGVSFRCSVLTMLLTFHPILLPPPNYQTFVCPFVY